MRTFRILVAEDDPAHQRLLELSLVEKRPFIDVYVVSTGAEFKRRVQEQQFDCVIIDYRLPDAEADELLQAAKEDLGDCPALVTSSVNDADVVISSFRHGSVDFIPKAEAFDGEKLWDRVAHAIHEAQQRRSERNRIERRQNELVRLSETDPLTGLRNRRYLDRQLRRTTYQRDRRRRMSCVLMDIDHFKNINDLHGHGIGDAVLREIADVTRRHLSGGDMALRWGGEEFLILKASTDLAQVWTWAEKLKSRIAQRAFRAGWKEFGATVSMGIVSFPTAQMSHEMIDLADQAMYLAKRQGRDRVCTWSMVAVDRALRDVGGDGPTGPHRRRQWFLDACDGMLGPTQKQHLTTHCEQVASTAAKLARAMGLPKEKVAQVRLAGLIHDLGKSVIPEELLAQPGPLTKGQWALMSRHAAFGAEMGLKLGVEDAETIACVRHHHRPYREATRGPVGAKVVCVADALSAMTADRPYRPARSVVEALDELRRGARSQFDPAVVSSAHFVEPLFRAKSA